jgi:aryl sulfotransferase
MLIHFNDMKRDLPGSIRRIAAFLDIAVDERTFPKIVDHCGFDYMKAHAETVAPLGGVLWQGGAQTFVNKGTNGRWQGTLTAAEVAAYQAKAMAELGPDCARWLAMGEAR